MEIELNKEDIEKAEQLLETYYLDQLIEISNLTEEEALAILIKSGLFDLPEVMPL